MKNVLRLLIATLFVAIAIAVPTPINTQSFRLTTDMTSLADSVNELYSTLEPRLRTVGQVLESANRANRALCHDLAISPVLSRSGSDVSGFCWNQADDATNIWNPQGVTTSFDANETGRYDGNQIVLNSWYHQPKNEGPNVPNKGIKISFTEWNSEMPDAYRHVLLVEPATGGNFKAIPIHAGGIMWYGNYLYVADTWAGFRLFDMNHIFEMDIDRTDLIGRKSDGKLYAYGYQYILPQVGRLRNTGVSFRFSFVSLDRASNPPSMITGEYSDAQYNKTRLVRYPLNDTTYLPLAGDAERTYSSEAYETNIHRTQGVLARDSRFWFSSSAGAGGPVGRYGHLRVWDRNTTEVRSYDWTYGSEDLSYWGGLDGNDTIWSLTEWRTWRVVLGIPVTDWS